MPDLLTLGVALFIVALIAVYDIWTLVTRGYETTISAVTYNLSKRFPIIPFAIGVIAGHLWWPNLVAR